MKKVTPDPGAVRADPQTGSTVEVRGGLLVLHLRGTPYERGLAHGRLLRREIRRSRIASYFSDFLSALVGHSPRSRNLPAPLLRGLTRLLEWWFYTPLESLLLEESREEIEGVADGAGLERRTAARAILAPDLMQHLAAGFLRTGRPPDLAGAGGCSGAYARGAALADAAPALLARNMDFPGALVWRYPVVIFSHPEEEIEMTVEDGRGGFRAVRRRKAPYVYLTAAGFPGYGLTGLSASGIAVADFVVLSRGVSRRGLLSLDYNHWLLTRAGSLAGIRHLAAGGRMRCATPHAALFAAEEGALAVETDADGSALRGTGEGGDTLVQTNHFLDPGLSRRQMDYPLEREHSQGRFRTLEEELRAGRGRLDVRRMIDLLALNREPASGGTRLLGDFPAQLTTLSSVVFEPGTGRFWAAAGAPPAVSYGEFEGFELRDGGDGAPPRGRAPARPLGASSREALCLLARAQERLRAGRPASARRGVERARALAEDPGCEYLLALLCLLDGRHARALALLRGLRGRGLFPPVKEAALALWEARALDLLGRRAEARAGYRALAEEPGTAPGLRRAARRSLRRRFTAGRLPVNFDFTILGPLTFS